MVQDFGKRVKVENTDGTSTSIKLNIWDAAGDGSVHNLAHLFVYNVQVAILVYSIDSKRSFDDVDDWYKHLKEKE